MKQEHVQLLYVLATVAAIIFSLSSLTYVVIENRQQARQGVEAHTVQCAEKVYYDQAVKSSDLFVSMTLQQRIRKYGPLLGKVPVSVIDSNLVKQRQISKTFDTLTCPKE